MQRRLMLALGLAVLFGTTAVSPVWTQAPRPKDKDAEQAKDKDKAKPEEKSQFGDADKFIKEHDKNKDGVLSKDELPKDFHDSFSRLDRNNDGKLNKEELQAHARAMRRQPPLTVTYIWVCEANRNDVSREDLQQAYEFMRKLDGNNDGKITQEELKTH